TLAGNTATTAITSGQTTTLTFVNALTTITISTPPQPLLLPPPPPLPPPPLPAAGRARAAFLEIPVIPEADSLALVVGGLVTLGGVIGLRWRRRRDGEA